MEQLPLTSTNEIQVMEWHHIGTRLEKLMAEWAEIQGVIKISSSESFTIPGEQTYVYHVLT
jgi:hypothetical protein